MGQLTLRITIEQKDQSEQAAVITLEGRVAGPFAAELGRVWVERAPQLALQKLSLDLSDVTYADADGIQVLRGIYVQAQPELLAPTPWARHLAEQIAAEPHDVTNHEPFN
jgi:anti-anti-sigma regulatory factor